MITIIFDRCHHSSAKSTNVKNKHDIQKLKCAYQQCSNIKKNRRIWQFYVCSTREGYGQISLRKGSKTWVYHFLDGAYMSLQHYNYKICRVLTWYVSILQKIFKLSMSAWCINSWKVTINTTYKAHTDKIYKFVCVFFLHKGVPLSILPTMISGINFSLELWVQTKTEQKFQLLLYEIIIRPDDYFHIKITEIFICHNSPDTMTYAKLQLSDLVINENL